MSERPKPPQRKAPWIIGAVLLTVAASGYFMGLQQTTSQLKMTEPRRVVRLDSERRASLQAGPVPVAVVYSNQNWLREGINADWKNDLASLAALPASSLVATNLTEAERRAALGERASRRAYEGAPPVIPHPISQDSSAVCLSCHGPGLTIRDRVASKISHPFYASCTQCHVPVPGPVGTELGIAENEFVGWRGPGRGTRAWPGAPPTIPHGTTMRTDCLSCHGPTGLVALRTSHPERAGCQQCHVPEDGRFSIVDLRLAIDGNKGLHE